MKSASAGLIALLANSNQYAIWETYEFTFPDGSSATWTNGDVATASQLGLVVNLDANVNAGLTSAVGITISGLDPAATYKLSLPPFMPWVAWSRWPNDAQAAAEGAGAAPWSNAFRVTQSSGTEEFGVYLAGPTAAMAQAAFPDDATITGDDTYVFWIYDDIILNRGGLSIRLLKQ